MMKAKRFLMMMTLLLIVAGVSAQKIDAEGPCHLQGPQVCE